MNTDKPAFRTTKDVSAVVLVLLLAVAAALVLLLVEVIDVLDEGLMRSTVFESEPKEGWDYWRWKAIKKALPSWIIGGTIWLSLMVPILYFAYCHARNLLSRRSKG